MNSCNTFNGAKIEFPTATHIHGMSIINSLTGNPVYYFKSTYYLCPCTLCNIHSIGNMIDSPAKFFIRKGADGNNCRLPQPGFPTYP